MLVVKYHDKYLQNTVPFDEIESFPVAFVGGGERNCQVPMDKCEVKEILKSPEEVRLSASKFPSKKQNEKDSPPEPPKQLSLL